jgi:type IV fimbrial biogenesis protein FimT
MRTRYKSAGFTLLELMIVVAIVAVMTRLAAPSFKYLIQSNTMSGTVNSFLSDMRFARSEAIRRGGVVELCRSNSPEASTPVCNGTTGATNGWVTGWFIWYDLNDNGTVDTNEVLRVQAPITIVDSIVESNASPNYKFRFGSTGRLNLSSATTIQFGSNAMFANEAQRTVCVHLSGRARIAGDGLASCP